MIKLDIDHRLNACSDAEAYSGATADVFAVDGNRSFMRSSYLDSFATLEILFDFSKAIRHSLIAIESLNDLSSISFST